MNPNIIDMIPIMMNAVENALYSFLMFQPINTEEIPKNNKLRPMIIETRFSKNIGNIMNIIPNMIDRIPALLFMNN